MHLPPTLIPGDTIIIVCPSGYLPIEKSLQAKKVLEEWGYKIILGKTTQTENYYFSGTDEERLADLQAALDYPDAKAILMGRGGYGLSRIIDDLNFEKFLLHPKWVIGFSDITVLHAHLQQNFNIASLHAPMCGAFAEENLASPFMQTYKDVLAGQHINYVFPSHERNVLGNVSGTVVGGNLCMLEHLTGSISSLDTSDNILFIEDIGEHLYKIDRMLYNLKRSKQLKHIKALLCGNFSDMQDTTRPFGKDIYQIILDIVNPYQIPVAFELPIGHETINYPIILGASYSINISNECVSIEQQIEW